MVGEDWVSIILDSRWSMISSCDLSLTSFDAAISKIGTLQHEWFWQDELMTNDDNWQLFQFSFLSDYLSKHCDNFCDSLRRPVKVTLWAPRDEHLMTLTPVVKTCWWPLQKNGLTHDDNTDDPCENTDLWLRLMKNILWCIDVVQYCSKVFEIGLFEHQQLHRSLVCLQ